jgi:hypothetical protein
MMAVQIQTKYTACLQKQKTWCLIRGMETRNHPDAALIDGFGGPKKFAEMLGMKDGFAQQRVSNWKRRGVPSAVKCEHPHIFFGRKQAAGADAAQGATETVAQGA